jgi:uncharacterized LabA/DUF88 family protein
MKTAVFYDLENVQPSAQNGDFTQSIISLQEKIKSSELTGDIILQKAYIRKTFTALEQIESDLKKCGVELVTVEPVVDYARKKTNMVDFKMSVDVIATVAAKRSVTTVAMVSGDGDFGFTCEQIKKMGKKLLVVSRFPTTGNALMKICDDWVDLSGQAMTPKFIRKAIETRLAPEKTDQDFFCAFGTFLGALETDYLLRRYMTVFGLPFSMFSAIVQEKVADFPKYGELGITRQIDFMDIILGETPFECNNSVIYYRGSRKRPPSQKRLIQNILLMPGNYSREKLLNYYDMVASLENLQEFLTYIAFMRRVGMLNGNKLCNKRTFRATIRKHIRNVAAKAGFVLDEVNKKL